MESLSLNLRAVLVKSIRKASEYIEEEKLAVTGISLEYMEYNYPEYLQLYPPFDPYVSILDLLFMMGPEASRYISKGDHV